MQSKFMSIIEVITNIIIGVIMSIIINIIAAPLLLGVSITLTQNLIITMIFIVSSMVRSYCLRRFFNRFQK